MNILLVDDDPIALRVVGALLRDQGHQVTIANDGAEGLALFAAGNFPVVVTDWVMPKLDGIELVGRIRNYTDRPYTYVIFLTAKVEHSDAVRALSEGADDLLAKPVQQADLVARLRVAERILGLQTQLIARNQQVESVNQRMQRDLDAAGRVQRALLPIRSPAVAGWQAAWRSQPCDELAGDTLNVFQLDEHHIAGYVLDVSGHGVSAALLAVQVSRLLSPLMSAGSMLKESAAPPTHYRLVPPLELLRNLAVRFPFQIESPQFFTIIYVIIDVRSGEAIIASAGHPGPLVLGTDGVCRSQDLASNAIGMLDASLCEFAELRLTVQPGERLVLYSDGISEARNQAGEVFDAPRIAVSIERSREQPLETALDQLLADLATFTGGRAVGDDISLLAIERDRTHVTTK